MGLRSRLFISLLLIVGTISSSLFFLHRDYLHTAADGAVRLQSDYTFRLVDQYLLTHIDKGKSLEQGKALNDLLAPLIQESQQLAYLRLRRPPTNQQGALTGNNSTARTGDIIFEHREAHYQEVFSLDDSYSYETPYYRQTKAFQLGQTPYLVDIALDLRETLKQRLREEGAHIVTTILLMLAGIGLGLWLFRDYIRGIASLNYGVKAIEDGNLNYRIDHSQLNELKPTAEAFNNMAGKLAMVAQEQQNLYQDLLEKDRRLELILNNTEEAILGVGKQLDVQIANSAALKMLGVDDIDDIYASTALMPEVLLRITKPDNTQDFYFEDTGVINAKGYKVPVEMRGSQLNLKNDEKLILISMRNLTVEKSIRHAYEEENNLKAALMDASLDSILLLDSVGTNISYNISMFNLVNRLTRSHHDLNALQILNIEAQEHEGIIDALDRLELVNTGVHSCQRICPDGEVIHLEFNIQTFDTQGHLYYTLVIRDITQKVKNQFRLEQALSQADAANIAKSQFLAAMSHEIRTPLNGIQGSISLLEKSPLTEDQKELLHAAEISSEALMQLINDILDFAKIEAGKMELETLEVSLQSVLKEAITIITPRASEKQLKIELSVDPSINHCVLCDAGRLRQICLNLLSNAVKFTEQGSIRLSMLALPTARQQLSLRVLVEDNGIGIPHEKQELLFNEFTQVNQTDSRRHGGTGLGLAISQKLAELMGGYIVFSSEPDIGSSFAIYLSLPLTETPITMIPQQTNTRVAETLRSGRILIVEDSITNQMIASRMLSSFNQQYEIANDGLEALQAVQERPFDLILMDLQMPEMNGYEATEAIRKIPELIDTPIVAMTANVMTSDKEKCFSVGMNDFLPKPVQMGALENLLYRWLGSDTKDASVEPDTDVPRNDQLTPSTNSIVDNITDNSDLPEVLSLSAIHQMERDIGTDRCLQMIEIVKNELSKRSQALYDAFAQSDGDAVQHQAHTLKSTSASFGLLQLSQLSKLIEHHYRFGSDEDIETLVKRMPEVLDISITALENYRDTLEVN